MATVEDHRTPEEVKATQGYVVATDRMMSGWGKAPGKSYFAIPIATYEGAVNAEYDLRRRKDFNRIRFSQKFPRLKAGDHITIRPLYESGRK